MKSAKLPAVLLCVALLCSVSAMAEEDGHSKGTKPGSSPPAKTPASGNRESNRQSGSGESLGEEVIEGVLSAALGAPSAKPSQSPPSTPFIFATELQKHGFLGYIDAGIGASVLNNPAIGDPNFAWQIAAGIRTKYLGAELSMIALRGWNSLWNDPKYVQTYSARDNLAEAYAFFLTGYAPLSQDSDFILKLGKANLSITDYSNPNTTAYYDVSNWARGAGLEIRGDGHELFFRFEAEYFGKMLQFRPQYYAVIVGGYY